MAFPFAPSSFRIGAKPVSEHPRGCAAMVLRANQTSIHVPIFCNAGAQASGHGFGDKARSA
jgi:hypothetical protein